MFESPAKFSREHQHCGAAFKFLFAPGILHIYSINLFFMVAMSTLSGSPGWKRTIRLSFAALERFPGYFPCSRWAQLSGHREATIGDRLGVTPRRRRLCPRLEGAVARPGGQRGPGQPSLLYSRARSCPAPLAPGPEAPLSCPEPLEAGTQVGGAGAGPERGTGWTVGKMAAAVAGPRGRGAADTDTDTDSGNGSGNGVGPSLLLKRCRPPLWAVSDLGGLSSLPRPRPPVGPWPFFPPGSGPWAEGRRRSARGTGPEAPARPPC